MHGHDDKEQAEQQRRRPINELIRPGVLLGCFHRAGVENRHQHMGFVRSSLGHSGLQQNIYVAFVSRSECNSGCSIGKMPICSNRCASTYRCGASATSFQEVHSRIKIQSIINALDNTWS